MYIKYVWFVNEMFWVTLLLNESKLICLHTVKWFQVLKSYTNIAQSAEAVECTDCTSAEG